MVMEVRDTEGQTEAARRKLKSPPPRGKENMPETKVSRTKQINNKQREKNMTFEVHIMCIDDSLRKINKYSSVFFIRLAGFNAPHLMGC